MVAQSAVAIGCPRILRGSQRIACGHTHIADGCQTCAHLHALLHAQHCQVLDAHEISRSIMGIQGKLYGRPGKIWSLMRFVGSPQLPMGAHAM